MELVNQERWTWNNGQLPPLKRQLQLEAAAEGHSNRMATQNFFSHCDLDSLLTFGQRIVNQGYFPTFAAENVAAGQSTPQAVMSTWMTSVPHRENILRTSVREIGIGYFYQSADQSNIRFDLNGDCSPESSNNGPYYHYWTQNFGARSNVYPVVINREAFMTNTRTVSLYIYGAGWSATEMRIRNASGAFTAWVPFATSYPWTLSSGNGTKTVIVEIRKGGTVHSASDTIVLDGFDPNLLFGNGFESGATVAWDTQVP